MNAEIFACCNAHLLGQHGYYRHMVNRVAGQKSQFPTETGARGYGRIVSSIVQLECVILTTATQLF